MAAASSDNGIKRSNAKSPGKTEKQNRKTQVDDSDKICGFHPLRSLRNIFFGYRTRGKRSLDEDVEPSAKAKSTDDIVQQTHHQLHQNDEPTTVVIHAPVTPTKSASHRLSRTSIPMVKQLSKSADNLVSPADWIPAPHGIPSAIAIPCGSEDSSLDASLDEIDGNAVLDSNSVDEFFTNKWSDVRSSRTRAFSSGDAEGSVQESTFDLDSVHQTKALDVSVAKDRISVKPKGKRVSVAMQQKMLKAEAAPKPTRSYHLHSLTEADENEDEGNKAPKTGHSATAAGDGAQAPDEAPATPDRPIRREKRLQPAPDKSGRITINITPDMLAGARKKAVDRVGNSPLQSSATTNPRTKMMAPPPPTCPKKRKTICESEGGTGVQEDKKKEVSKEEPAQNGAALGVSMARPPLVSLTEDEVVAVEEGDVARPKAPPRVRPKTRPKTMIHSVQGAPQTTQMEPEWATRVNKTNPLVD